MIDPRAEAERERVKRMLSELDAAGVKHSKVALLLNLHHTTVSRIAEHGRCEGWIRDMIAEIHREHVPHETLQSHFVIRTQALVMTNA